MRAGSFRGCCARAARTLSRAHAPRPARSPNPQTGRLSRASLSALSSLGHACARGAVEQRSNRSDPGAVRAFTRLKQSALVLSGRAGRKSPDAVPKGFGPIHCLLRQSTFAHEQAEPATVSSSLRNKKAGPFGAAALQGRGKRGREERGPPKRWAYAPYSPRLKSRSPPLSPQ